ncbi:MAG: flippase-like domain-containing protein [Candidatus Bathyarchaeota archaeon]|nr:flippase-like domain-containing protein [Candidatus Bathyarchaeota archaeon]
MALGLVAFILYLWVFVGFDGLFNLLSALNVYQYSLFFSLAVVALVLAVIFDSLIWHSLLDALSVKIRLRKIVLYNWIGNFVELILPSATIGGEVARIALAQKETKHDTGIAAATVIGSRIITTFVYSGGLIVAFLLLLFSHRLPIYLVTPVILVVLGTSAVIGVVFLIAFKEAAVDRIVNVAMWITRRIIKNPSRLESIKQRIHHGLSSFSDAFKTFKDQPRQLIKPIIFAIISWMLYLVVYLMVFYALNFTAISLIDLATVYCIITTVETLTAGVPVGAVEVTMINLFSLYGVPIAVAGAATTITRLLTFWCQVLVGYPLIEWIGAKHLIKGSLPPPTMIKPPIIQKN